MRKSRFCRYLTREFPYHLNLFIDSCQSSYFDINSKQYVYNIKKIPQEGRAIFVVSLFFIVLTDELVHCASTRLGHHGLYSEFKSLLINFLWSRRFSHCSYRISKKRVIPKLVNKSGRISSKIYTILTVPVELDIIKQKQVENEIIGLMPEYTGMLGEYLPRKLKNIKKNNTLLNYLWFDYDFRSDYDYKPNDSNDCINKIVVFAFKHQLIKCKILREILSDNYQKELTNRIKNDKITPIPLLSPKGERVKRLIKYITSNNRICPVNWNQIVATL